MVDITMCAGGNCPSKETCFRYTAKPSCMQSYFAEIPHCTDFCVFYLHDWRKENEHFEKKRGIDGKDSEGSTSTDTTVLV